MSKLNIEVYSKNQCVNCVTAKTLLKQKNLDFIEKLVEDTDIREELLNRLPTAKQLPQIFINDKSIGSLSGLQTELKRLGL